MPCSLNSPNRGDISQEANSSSMETLSVSSQSSNFGKVPRLHKISTFSIFTLGLTLVMMVLAAGFLFFLWSNPASSNSYLIWFSLVSNHWTLTSITITTLVTRISVSAQAVVCTSMLASIILERRSVTIYGSARLSSLRSGNDGPISLITALYGNYRNASLWSIVAILLFCTTLVLQFASTILVMDIGIGKIAEPDRENATLVALSYDNLDISAMAPTRQAPYWLEATKSFPTFAENSSPAIWKYLGNEPMRDTGVSHRAFVPFLNSTIRTSMKRFAGIATVVDSRVACVRPKIHDGFSVALTQERRWLLNGTLTPEVLPEGLILGDSPAMTGDLDTVSFNATIDGTRNITLDWAQEIPFAHDAGEWNIIQKLVYLGPGLVSSLDPRYPKIIQDKALIFNMSNADDTRGWGLSYLLDGDDIPLMTGRSYLLLNMTVLEHPSPLPDKLGPFDPKNLYFSSSQEQNQLVLTPQDDWLIFTLPRVPGWHLSVSLCFDSFTSVDANVTITSERPVTEPNLRSWNPRDMLFDTKDIRRQLGVLNHHQNYTDREVMRLETTPENLREQVKVWYDNSRRRQSPEILYPSQNFIRDSLKEKNKLGALMCAGCGLQFKGDGSPRIAYQVNNMVQQQIFQDVMITTNNTAKAWQAFFTLVGGMAYYDKLPFFDVNDSAMISWFQSAQFPRTRRGFWVVITVLSIHFIVVMIITCCFIMKTEVSRVGDNAWQCLAQTNYDLEDDILRSLMIKDDNEVKTLFDKRNLDKRTVSLAVIEQNTLRRIGLRSGMSSADVA